MPTFVDFPLYSERFIAAISFGARLHQYQTRKDGQTPYLAHLLSVTALVMEYGGSEDEMIAAMLHDAVEDAGGNLEDIQGLFGENVARIVAAVSEDKLLPSGERKQRYIEAVVAGDISIQRVSAADKLHNSRTLTPEMVANSVTIGFYATLSDSYALVPEMGAAIRKALDEKLDEKILSNFVPMG